MCRSGSSTGTHLEEVDVGVKGVGEQPLAEGEGGRFQPARARVVLHQPEGRLAAQQAGPDRLLDRRRVTLRSRTRSASRRAKEVM